MGITIHTPNSINFVIWKFHIYDVILFILRISGCTYKAPCICRTTH